MTGGEKKTIGAAERDEAARADWREVAAELPARRVVVLDECGSALDMATRFARAARGVRAQVSGRYNTGKHMTLLAGITLSGMTAPFVVEGAVTVDVMETYLQQVLLPTLHPGDIVILDNLRVHHTERVTQLLTRHGCRLLFLPAYSPDLSPIENAFSKIKTVLRRLRAQTVDALLDAIVQALDAITVEDAIGYFTNAGFFNLD